MKKTKPGDDRYAVTFVAANKIKLSPEDEVLYGVPDHDSSFDALVDSIEHIGLEEPLILEADNHIMSGHRRFDACWYLEWEKIPCRIKHDVRRSEMSKEDYMRLLAEYDPQRVKTVDAILRETFLQLTASSASDIRTARGSDDDSMSDAMRSIFKPSVEPEYMDVDGTKVVDVISEKRMQFLRSVVDIVEKLKDFWPLSMIHYQLLNDPPLKQNPQRSQFSAREIEERYRYRNDKASYDATSRLCVSARYLKHIAFDSVDDPTRTIETNKGFSDAREFIEYETKWFLRGYVLDKQRSQPIHIEALAEKNTLGIMRPVCKRYNVPLTSGRGFAGPSIWRKMATRFHASGKERFALLVVSDFDPEGFELADDAIRSLRDLWRVPVDYFRIAVTREQIDELDLAQDFNPAKESSPRYKAFVERTGSDKSWECEALPPEYLRGELEKAINANMNAEIYAEAQAQEERDVAAILKVKNELSRYFA